MSHTFGCFSIFMRQQHFVNIHKKNWKIEKLPETGKMIKNVNTAKEIALIL